MSVALAKTSNKLLTTTVCGLTTVGVGVGVGVTGVVGIQLIPQYLLLVKPEGDLPSIKYELFLLVEFKTGILGVAE